MTLTREQILAMPAGAEMDCLIAEKILDCHVIDGACACKRRGAILLPFADLQHGDPPISGMARYSSEIAAAWEVIAKFEHGETTPEPGWSWPVEITRIADSEGPERAGWNVSLAGQEALAPEMPLAACRAALLSTL